MDTTYEQVTVKCAWHQRNFGQELVMRRGANPNIVSHGICRDCVKVALASCPSGTHIAACSGCAGDYEDPDATNPPDEDEDETPSAFRPVSLFLAFIFSALLWAAIIGFAWWIAAFPWWGQK